MAVSLFTRFVNIRNVMHISNFGATGSILNVIQRSDVSSKLYCIDIQKNNDILILKSPDKIVQKKMSKAMKAYLQRSKEYKQFMEKEIVEYNIGKRHLATMMGEDPDYFTQLDIDRSIKYLFPSGIYDKQARPIMKHPEQLYESRKEAEFDDSGRPHHFLFYTVKPNYYETLYKLVGSLNYLNKMEDKKLELLISPTPEDQIDVTGSEWIDKEELEKILLEKLLTREYTYFITSMERLIKHPFSNHVKPFIMKYRKPIQTMTDNIEILEIEYDTDNRPFVFVDNCWRKNCKGQVKVLYNGSGKITINGKDITYFEDIEHREQVSKQIVLVILVCRM